MNWPDPVAPQVNAALAEITKGDIETRGYAAALTAVKRKEAVMRAMAPEPNIEINGQRMTRGQSTTIRNAVENFASFLQTEGLGDDEHGRAMAAAYMDRIREIRAVFMLTKIDR